MTARTDRPSYWIRTMPATVQYPPLEADAVTDVLVVGAGITGLTAAYLLGKDGRDVLVVDRHEVAVAETGHTTAHVAFVTDKRLATLAAMHGEDGARAAWDGGAFAVNLIEQLAGEEGVDCDFARVDGFLYDPDGDKRDDLAADVRLARRFGYEADLVPPEAVPFHAEHAAVFPDQARFHPRKYLLGLLDAIDAFGVRVHEHTEVRDVTARAGGERPVAARARVAANGGADDARDVTVRAKRVIIASHVPFVDRFRMWTKLYPYRSYAIAARVPRGRVPDALYWDTLDPYHYARVQPDDDQDVVIFGGEDHKVGQEKEARDAFEKLEIALREALLVDFDVEWAWSAQDPETPDALPFVGANPGSPARELIATGYGGNGMTFGTLAAWMLAERVSGRDTRWDALLDPARKTLRGARTFLEENVDYPTELARGFLKRRHGPPPLDLAPGEGAVVTRGRRKLAVSRDPGSGEWRVVNATCTHMGCVVSWNNAEASWDCPCHGSRFRADGEILNGPAAKPLTPADPADAGVPEAAVREGVRRGRERDAP